MLLLYCLPLHFKVWQRNGACCCCYIVYHYCLRFDRGRFMLLVVIMCIITVWGLTEKLFMLWLLCFLPLLLKVWQKGCSCCCCHIVYHCCLRFDSGVIHVIVAILPTITVCGLTEEWFMLLLLYGLPLLFKVWQRNGSCFGWLYCLPLLFNVWQRSGSCCCCYMVYHCC